VSGAPIVEIASDGVTLQWLKVVAPTTGACDSTVIGIAAWEVDDAQIVSNRILADPKGPTIGGLCGLSNGIEIGDGSARASVRNNLVRDFQVFGIRAWSSDAMVVNNSVQYWHRAACPTADVCRKGPGTAALAVTTGIGVSSGTGLVSLNAVTNAPEGQSPTVGLPRGIEVSSSPGLRVRKNLVRAAEGGILVIDSDRVSIRGNVVVGAFPPAPGRASPSDAVSYGIWVTTTDEARIRDNHALHWTSGIVMNPSTAGATITGNDFTGNALDCNDSSASGHTWTDNLGNLDVPSSSLCTDGPIQDIPGSPT
jgi:nitrous oxidase accessory protein NosD